MSRKFLQITFSLLLLTGMLLGFAMKDGALANALQAPLADNPTAKFESLLLSQLNSGSADFIIMMTEQADLSAAYQLQTKAEKGQYVFDTLTATADRTQADLRAYLDSQSVDYQAFYIVNAILVKNGTLDLAQSIAARPDVATISANHTFQLQEPMINPDAPNSPTAVESNISFVNADDVWTMGYTGQGTVVAGNDTGLYWSHPALVRQYRGCLNPPDCTQIDHNFNWWDATGTYPTVPDDGHGHGTHTTGTMVGDDGVGNQIGMAPGARTVHCKNMDNGGGGQDAWFLTCFQWDLAPWDLSGANPTPAYAPDSVNNSWGYWGGGNNVFRGAVDALLAAGTVVEVSAGNEGAGCTTLRSPGDYQEVFTTGSVQHSGGVMPGTITGFSSRGPSSLDGGYFPDFMAPGENIRSSVPGGGYQGGWSGTSMSGPHVTALIGLIWSANPALRGQIQTTYDIIQQTVIPLSGQPGSNCGGDYQVGPNNDWGWGTIDAYAAVNLAISYGGSGTLQGTVTDAVTLLPVAGATVNAAREEGGAWSDITDASGFYQITVAAGTFDITASHPHYVTGSAEDVVVVEDGTTVQDFSLTPRGWAFGYVYDFDNGTPIVGATVTAEDASFATTDVNGYYELWLDVGEHTLTATAPDYAPESAVVNIVSGFGTWQDFYLQAAVVFIPSPINVNVPLGTTFSQPATILNRQPWDYAFEFQERDGGYLPLGGQSVNVALKAGPSTVPANTAVAFNGYEARPVSTVTITPKAGGINQTNVLLLNADYDNDGYSPIRDMLVAYGDLDSVTLFDARYATPSLDELLAYNVVVVWSNFMFADSNGMGNVLADYVDAGGKVIDLEFGIDPNWGYQGRFRTEGYTAMTTAGMSYMSSCLGTFDAGHPIMDGITDVCDLYRGYVTALTAGSTEVARWQDNELFVAVKDDGSVATINGYVGQAFQWSGQMADVLHNAILWIAVPADVPWLSEVPEAGIVPAEGSLPVDINFDASPAAGVTQPGSYFAELTVKGDPKVKVPVYMYVEAPQSWGRIEGTVMGLGYCDQEQLPLKDAVVEITGATGNSWTLLTDANGHWAVWLDSAENPLTIEVSATGYFGQSTTANILPGGNVVVDFGLRWDKPCLTADPLTMSATLDMGATNTQQLTLTNTGAGAGTFEMSDLENGYTPMRQGFLPAATRPSTPDTTPTSIGRAPNAPSISGAELGKAIAQLVGEPAFAVDVYPGYNLVTFLNDNPGGWTVVAGLPGNQYFAGDFINGDFSTLYVIDYATNTLYTVNTTTGAVTTIGPSTPRAGETWTGLTGATDGTMYGSTTNISRSTLYTIDLATGASTEVGEITNAPAIIDIAVTPGGEMFGVDIVNDNLVQIDPATGAGTVIGYIGFNANYAQGMDYEETSGTLYLAAYSSQGELRIADPATGNTVLVGAFPGGAEVDSLGFATGGGGDALWLSENPASGTIPGYWPLGVSKTTEGTAPRTGQTGSVTLNSIAVPGGSVQAGPWQPTGPVELELDDGSPETSIGIGGTWEFVFVNRFTPDPSFFPLNITEVSVFFPSFGLVNVGDNMELVLYENTSGNFDPANGANFLASFPVTVQSLDQWDSFTLPYPVTFYGPGDVIVGVVALEVPGTSYWPAALDTTASQQRSWAGWWLTAPPPEPPLLPPDDTWMLIDDFMAGNWLIRASGETVPAGGNTQVVDVTFDAGQVTQPGTYTGQVKAKTNDPVAKTFTVDVTMYVNAPANWGQLSGTVTGLGYCDANPAPLQGAQVAVEGGLTVETDANGGYLLWLENGTYNLTVTKDGHTVGTATVVIVGQQMTVQDFNLRWTQPCLSEDPASLEVTLDLGATAVEQLTLTNNGAAEGTFTVVDMDKGYTPKLAQKPPMPTGKTVTPMGASSNAAVQPFKSRINAAEMLLITTTDTSQSVERALNELGYVYDYYYGSPWTGIDFSPYSVVFVAMDGGLAEIADIQKLRTDVIDEGKTLIFLGGTCYQPFAQGMNDYLVQNDVNNYCWQVTGQPNWTLTDPTHPLAAGLPDSYNYANTSAGYYQIRVTDPDAEVVGVNGESWPAFFRKTTDGNFIWYVDSVYSSYWMDANDYAFLKQVIQNSVEATGGGDALWLSENPTAGTVAPDGATQVIDVTFDASVVTQPGTYMAEIMIKTNDSVNKKFVVPAVMNVNGPADWGRVEGTVNSLGYCEMDPSLLEGATVEIVGGPTLVTDANGHYSTWLANGTYTINVTADGHLAASAVVVITPQQTTVQDFALRRDCALCGCRPDCPGSHPCPRHPDYTNVIACELRCRRCQLQDHRDARQPWAW